MREKPRRALDSGDLASKNVGSGWDSSLILHHDS